MMKVKLFITDMGVQVQDEINEWLEAEKVGPSDIFKVAQSESDEYLTISIWYLPRPTIQS